MDLTRPLILKSLSTVGEPNSVNLTFFFFNDTATTEIYTLSLHDALPISSKMAVTVQEIVAHYSPMSYSAGDVLSTGTVSGVAAFSDDPKSLYLQPGDIVECEIEKIGVLRNPVVSYQELHGGKAARA